MNVKVANPSQVEYRTMDFEEFKGSEFLEQALFNSHIHSSETDLWQSDPGQDSVEDGEQYVRSSNETNVIKLVKSREIGPKPLFPTRTLRNRALAELLKDRWQCADMLTKFHDATNILNRSNFI